jgi:hypothetical protein
MYAFLPGGYDANVGLLRRSAPAARGKPWRSRHAEHLAFTPQREEQQRMRAYWHGGCLPDTNFAAAADAAITSKDNER